MEPNSSVPFAFGRLGNYDLISVLVRPGFGTVYLAKHRRTGELAVVHAIDGDAASKHDFRQEFERAKFVDHPNVVWLYECRDDGPVTFVAMEYVGGKSLDVRVRRDGPIPEAEAIRLIGQVCEGFHWIHEHGVLYADLTPGSILATADGFESLVPAGTQHDGIVCGTRVFIAPERFLSFKPADIRSNVYSLGATLYAMLTGMTPFAGVNSRDCLSRKAKDDLPEPRTIDPAISRRVSRAVVRAMRADPAARPANCREFMADLTADSWWDAGPVARLRLGFRGRGTRDRY